MKNFTFLFLLISISLLFNEAIGQNLNPAKQSKAVFNITVNTVVGGTATVTTLPDATCEEAETVTVTISDIEAGKQFSAIDVIAEDLSVISTTEVTAGEEYTFTMPAQNVTVTVTLEDIPVPVYDIIVNVTGGTADVTTDPVDEAEEDATVTVSISNIEDGKQFSAIDVIAEDLSVISTAEVTAGEEYTFTMPAQNVTVTVTFEVIPPIVIHTQPESAIICEYESADLTVIAEASFAETLEYQWYYNSEILEGETNNVLNTQMPGQYYCLLIAGEDELQTNQVTVNVVEVNPVLEPEVQACEGTSVQLYPGVFVGYEWQDLTTEQFYHVTEDGTYSVTVTGDNGCTASASTVVTFVDELTIPWEDTTKLCSGSNIILTAPTADSYEWGEGEVTSTLEVTEEGWYYLTVTLATCTGNDSIYVELAASPEEFELGEDISVCDGTTVTINGPVVEDVEYLWNTEETTQNIEVTETGTYSLTLTNEFGCETSDFIYIVFNDFIVPDLHTSDSIYSCAGETVTLDPQEGIAWLWSDASTESTLDVTTNGWYYVTVTVTGGCEGSDSVYVLFHTLPLIDLGANQAICDGLNVLLEAPEDMIYSWNTGDSVQSITIDTAGVYSCTITDVNGCSNSDQMSLSIYNLPGVDLGSDIFVDETQTIILGVETGHPEYLWSTGATTDFIIIEASELELGPNTFSVTVTSNNDCIAEDEVIITVIPGAGIESNKLKDFSVYPNPSNGIINISGEDIISIDIFDSLGRYVVSTLERQIDLKDLAKGIYTIKISTKETSVNTKLILE